MRWARLLSRLTLALMLAATARSGLDDAFGAAATPARAPATTAGPRPPPVEDAEPADEAGMTDDTGETVPPEEEPAAEAETGTDAETAVEADPESTDATVVESDGEPAEATDGEAAATTGEAQDDGGAASAAAPDRPPEPIDGRQAAPGPDPAPPAVTPPGPSKERPSLVHRTPPPAGSPAPPPPKAEALPRPPRSLLGEGAPPASGGAPRSPASAAPKTDAAGAAPRAPDTDPGDGRGLPSLAGLTATRERPLFVPGRRGPDQRSAVAVTLEPAAPGGEIEPPESPFTAVLGGVVSGPGLELAILIDPSTNAVSRVKRGEDHDGWTLAELDRRTATFRRGDEQAVLRLKPPGSTVVPGVGGSDDEAPKPAAARPGPRPHGGPPPEVETSEE